MWETEPLEVNYNLPLFGVKRLVKRWSNASVWRAGMEFRVDYFSWGYFAGLVLLTAGVVAPLAWTAVRRKFLKGKFYRRA